jgi:hypothetical protein
MRLPPRPPRRFFAAQAMPFAAAILLVAGLTARAADQRQAEFLAPVSAFTGHFETPYDADRGYQRYLAGTNGQIPAEGNKKQEALPTDRIPIHLDGIFCHGLSVITLLFDMMP